MRKKIPKSNYSEFGAEFDALSDGEGPNFCRIFYSSRAQTPWFSTNAFPPPVKELKWGPYPPFGDDIFLLQARIAFAPGPFYVGARNFVHVNLSELAIRRNCWTPRPAAKYFEIRVEKSVKNLIFLAVRTPAQAPPRKTALLGQVGLKFSGGGFCTCKKKIVGRGYNKIDAEFVLFQMEAMTIAGIIFY